MIKRLKKLIDSIRGKKPDEVVSTTVDDMSEGTKQKWSKSTVDEVLRRCNLLDDPEQSQSVEEPSEDKKHHG